MATERVLRLRDALQEVRALEVVVEGCDAVHGELRRERIVAQIGNVGHG
jgi:hypothetical protein